MTPINLFIPNIHCASCKSNIESTIESLAFVQSATVNILRRTVQITLKQEQTDSQSYINIILEQLAAKNFPAQVQETKQMETIRYIIEGLHCASCVAKIESALSKLEGISSLGVNITTNRLNLTYNRDILSFRTIKETIQAQGYRLGERIELNQDKNQYIRQELKKLKIKGFYALLFSIPLLFITMGGMFFPLLKIANESISAIIQLALTLPILWLGRDFFIYGFRHLYLRSTNMDSLIAIGSSAAFIYSLVNSFLIWFNPAITKLPLYYESAAVIITLILLGRFLETKSKEKASEAINMLANLTPNKATLLVNGKQTTITSHEIEPNDLLLVKNGEAFPADGIIEEGITHANEAMITGESKLVLKEKGSYVIGATLNQGGTVTTKVTKPTHHSRLAQIIEVMENTQTDKPHIAKLADQIATYFVPIVICIALISAGAWLFFGASFAFALQIFISVLVIACPCSLGLATPTAVVVGSSKAASLGMLFKGAYALEQVGKINCLVFDKTGTITKGKMNVTNIDLVDPSFTKDIVLQYAASLEQTVSHPLAESICAKAKQNKLPLLTVKNSQSFPALGSKATLEQATIAIGNLRFMQQETTILEPHIIQEGNNSTKTLIYLAYNKKLIAIFTLEDVLKEEAKETIQAIKKLNITTSLLSGDRQAVANEIGKQAGLDEIIANVDPSEKANVIKEKQKDKSIVAMVGDGINDAPAMQQAHIGIALAKGSDIALEAANIIITTSSLQSVYHCIELSRALIVNIKQNLFWAFIYNIIGIPIAAGVLIPTYHIGLTPIFAAFAMTGSSLFVLLNALRFRFFKPSFNVAT